MRWWQFRRFTIRYYKFYIFFSTNEMGFQINHNIVFILGIIDWFFALIPCFVFPKCHKILRQRKYYLIAIMLGTTLFFINSFLVYSDSRYSHHERIIDYFLFFNPLLFLILYKIFDAIIFKRLKRHIYFRTLGGTDNETRGSTWFEFFLQLILGTSFLICAIIGKLLTK